MFVNPLESVREPLAYPLAQMPGTLIRWHKELCITLHHYHRERSTRGLAVLELTSRNVQRVCIDDVCTVPIQDIDSDVVRHGVAQLIGLPCRILGEGVDGEIKAVALHRDFWHAQVRRLRATHMSELSEWMPLSKIRLWVRDPFVS